MQPHCQSTEFNHSFPRTFSSKQGLCCSACSLIFPPLFNLFLLSISRQTAQPQAGAEQKSLQAASPSLLSISSLHQGKLRQGKNERARGKAEECQPEPEKGRHHPLHISKGDSLEEDDNGRAQSKPQPRCSYISISPWPAPGEKHRAKPGPAAGRWDAAWL